MQTSCKHSVCNTDCPLFSVNWKICKKNTQKNDVRSQTKWFLLTERFAKWQSLNHIHLHVGCCWISTRTAARHYLDGFCSNLLLCVFGSRLSFLLPVKEFYWSSTIILFFSYNCLPFFDNFLPFASRFEWKNAFFSSLFFIFVSTKRKCILKSSINRKKNMALFEWNGSFSPSTSFISI